MAKRKSRKSSARSVRRTAPKEMMGLRELGEGDIIIGLFLVVAGWFIVLACRVNMWITTSAMALVISGLILVGFGAADYFRSKK